MKDLSLAQLRQEVERLNGCSDDYERLSTDKLADRAQVRQQFVMVSRMFHPDLHISKSNEFRELTEEVFMRLSEAEQRLRKVLPPGQKRRVRRAVSNPSITETKKTEPSQKPASKQKPAPKQKPSPARKDAIPKNKAPSTLGEPVPVRPNAPRAVTSSSVPKAFLRRMRGGAAARSPLLDTSPTSATPKHAQQSAQLSPQEALEVAFQQMLQNPEDSKTQASAWLLRGQFALNQGQRDDAVEFFHRACMLDRGCVPAVTALQEIAEPPSELETRLLQQLLGSGI